MVFLKKNWLLITLAVAAALLAFFWYQNNLASKKPKKSEPNEQISGFELIGQKINQKTKINFTFTENYPTSAPLLKIEKAQPVDFYLATKMASSLGFTTQPKTLNGATSGTIWLWSQNNKSLTITPRTNELEYVQNLPVGFPPSTKNSFKETKELLQSAQPVLSSLNIDTTSTTQEENFISTDGKIIEDQNTLPAYKMVTLKQSLAGAEIIQATGQNFLVNIWFDSLGKIVKLSSANSYKGLSSFSKNYPVKNKEEVETGLVADGRIYSVEGYHSPLAPENIKEITVTKVAPGYFLPADDSAGQPLLVLSGTSQDTNGEIHNIKLILPAIKKDFYQ